MLKTCPGGAQEVRRCAVEDNFRVAAGRIEGRHGAAADPGAGQIHEVEAARALRILGEDDGEVGHVTVGHGELGARERAARGLGGEVALRGGLRAFGHGNRADDFPGGKLGQIGLLLRFATEGQEGFRRQVNAGGEGRRRQHPAQLLGDHAQLEVAQADAAVGLGDGGGGPAQFHDALPEGLVEGRVPLKDGAYGFAIAAIPEEAPGLLPQ